MDKHIAASLKKVADTMPIVFEWSTERIVMKGWELFLTPLADERTFEMDKDYYVVVPVMLAVEHRKQLKDAFNRGGWDEVKVYHRSVIDKIKTKKNESDN